MGTSTARVRALRERRRQNLSLFKIRITKAQIEALVSKGYLDRESCDDLTARRAAAEAWLIDALARPSARRRPADVPWRANANFLKSQRLRPAGAAPELFRRSVVVLLRKGSSELSEIPQ